MYLFAAHVAAHADDVAFVGGDHRQFVLLEHAAEGRELLGALLADLHREGQIAAIGKAEADQRMGDLRAHPVTGQQVHRGQLLQRIVAAFPVRRVILGAVPHEVAYLLEMQHFTLRGSLGPGACRRCLVPCWRDHLPLDQMCHLRRPVAVRPWRDAGPPGKACDQQHQVAAHQPPANRAGLRPPQDNHAHEPQHRRESRHGGAQPFRSWQAEP